jgi:hypothetical protein
MRRLVGSSASAECQHTPLLVIAADVRTWLGAAITIGSAVYIAFRERYRRARR